VRHAGSRAQRLAGRISTEGAERDVLPAVVDAISGIESLVGGNPARRRISAFPGKADLASFLLGLGEDIVDALKKMDVNSIAGCTEHVFDVLYLVDSEYRNQVESGLAKMADRSWWRDAHKLADEGASALAAMVMEASSCAERVQSTCIAVDLRSQFLDARDGDG
jgi:hypothetical protein